MSKNIRSQIQLINQAINTSNNALNLAKQLLRELEFITLNQGSRPNEVSGTRDVPGLIGSYDGEYMVTREGQKYAVPANYASKSQIVYGDTLKRLEQDGKEIFKQILRVKRQKVPGVLAKKEGRWVIVTADGSYKILSASVEHYMLKEGSEASAVLPLDNSHVPFAALEVLEIPSKGISTTTIQVVPKAAPTEAAEVDTHRKEEKKPGKEADKKVAEVRKPKADEKEISKKESSISVKVETPVKKASKTLTDEDLR